jgi:hypothetical protein
MADGPHSTYPRTWSRTANNLEREEADSLAKELHSRWPTSEYSVHVQVTGGADAGSVSVRVWNSTGIRECEVAYAADHPWSKHPLMSAALEEVEGIMKRLKTDRKL